MLENVFEEVPTKTFYSTFMHSYLLREAFIKIKCMNKDIVSIYFDPLPPPPNKDIKNKDILVSFLTPSLLPKIWTYEQFILGF